MKKIFALLLIAFSPPLLLAHPHVWIDVEVSPETNATGEIVALHERWLFDPLYAQMLLESVQREPNPTQRQQLWQYLQQDVLSNLNQENFYTASTAELASAKHGKLEQREGQLWLEVTIPLQKPVRQLSYQIYEQEYFVEILHSQQQRKVFTNGCKLTITPAQPSPEKLAMAKALDRNEKSLEPLGRYFSETGAIQCL